MAYMLCLGVTLGCLALGMVHQLSGGAWGVVMRRPIGAATRVLPVMTAALPCRSRSACSRLYPWTNADLVAHDEMLRHKQALPEHAVLPRSRGDLLRRLERASPTSSTLVARAGSQLRTRGSRAGCSS